MLQDTHNNSIMGYKSSQVGGDHYRKKSIQPVEYIYSNGLDFFEGNVVKYITRWRNKGGLQDLNKIKEYVDILIELEGLDETVQK